MLNVAKLITDLKVALPAGWKVEDALSMELVDAGELGDRTPLITIYQGKENYGDLVGSPCYQELDSEISFVVVCKTAELKDRLHEIRVALREWQGDADYHSVYRKLSGGSGSRVNVNSVYTWWQESWFTNYRV